MPAAAIARSCSILFGTSGRPIAKSCGKRLAGEHVLHGDEVGARDSFLDEPGDGLPAVVGVAVVEGDADAWLAIAACADSPLRLFQRNKSESLLQPMNLPANKAFDVVHGFARSSAMRCQKSTITGSRPCKAQRRRFHARSGQVAS